MTRIKICGLRRQEDAIAAIECGAHALGFVREPSSARCISETDYHWIANLPPVVLRVGVYGPYRAEPDLPVHAIQSIDDWGANRIIALRLDANSQPGSIKIGACGAIVLDARSDAGYGGTGERIDLDLAKAWLEFLKVPVYLAGGLTPENVADAIRYVRPFGVDVSSGVESSPGIKCAEKIDQFCRAVRSTD